jgi:hypothetical protein
MIERACSRLSSACGGVHCRFDERAIRLGKFGLEPIAGIGIALSVLGAGKTVRAHGREQRFERAERLAIGTTRLQPLVGGQGERGIARWDIAAAPSAS